MKLNLLNKIMISTVPPTNHSNGNSHESMSQGDHNMLVLSVEADSLHTRLVGCHGYEITCVYESKNKVIIDIKNFLTPVEHILIENGYQAQVKEIRAAINSLIYAEFEKLVSRTVNRRIVDGTVEIDLSADQMNFAFMLA